MAIKGLSQAEEIEDENDYLATDREKVSVGWYQVSTSYQPQGISYYLYTIS